MQDRVIFEYAIIRLVPQVEREEFLNVGAILYAKRKKFLGIKYILNEERLKAFSTQIDTIELNHYLEAWESVCLGKGTIGQLDLAFRFRWLTASKSTIIQSSKAHPGLCYDPKIELESIFKRYVL